jgi:hypothetical protein
LIRYNIVRLIRLTYLIGYRELPLYKIKGNR